MCCNTSLLCKVSFTSIWWWWQLNNRHTLCFCVITVVSNLCNGFIFVATSTTMRHLITTLKKDIAITSKNNLIKKRCLPPYLHQPITTIANDRPMDLKEEFNESLFKWNNYRLEIESFDCQGSYDADNIMVFKQLVGETTLLVSGVFMRGCAILVLLVSSCYSKKSWQVYKVAV